MALSRRVLSAGSSHWTLCEPGVQPWPDLLRCVGAAAPRGAEDHHRAARHARRGRQAEGLPPGHPPGYDCAWRAHRPRRGPRPDPDRRRAPVTPAYGGRPGYPAVDQQPGPRCRHVRVLDDRPAPTRHAEPGRPLPDLWSGSRHRGGSRMTCARPRPSRPTRYGQRARLRQLEPPPAREMEDALLRTIARLDGTPFRPGPGSPPGGCAGGATGQTR